VVQAAVLCSFTAAENRKYIAKTVKKPYGPQSKRKPSATFRKTTSAFRRQKYLQNSRGPRFEPRECDRVLPTTSNNFWTVSATAHPHTVNYRLEVFSDLSPRNRKGLRNRAPTCENVQLNANYSEDNAVTAELSDRCRVEAAASRADGRTDGRNITPLQRITFVAVRHDAGGRTDRDSDRATAGSAFRPPAGSINAHVALPPAAARFHRCCLWRSRDTVGGYERGRCETLACSEARVFSRLQINASVIRMGRLCRRRRRCCRCRSCRGCASPGNAERSLPSPLNHCTAC